MLSEILDQELSVSNVDNNKTNKKFPVSKILDFQGSIPSISIKKIPLDSKFYDMPVFEILIDKFNEIYEKKYSFDQILYSKSRFRAFYDFVFALTLSGKLKIKDGNSNNFMIKLEELQDEYNQNARSIEKYYDEIVETIYYPKGLTKKSEKVKQDMYYFEQAYSLMKLAFGKEKRDSGERYFEHLKGVMEIILREFDNPNLNKIIIALLHDLEEDLPEYTDVVRKIYGDYIADGVALLSKKSRQSYLFQEEVEKLQLCENEQDRKKIEDLARKRRNDDYFGHLDELNNDYLDVKLADRIHNLRDMEARNKEKISRKIEETEKYFLDVAKKRNFVAYQLITQELKKLKKMLDI